MLNRKRVQTKIIDVKNYNKYHCTIFQHCYYITNFPYLTCHVLG
jgi:hypothetical protein